jgi:hypothetical protein
MPKWTLEREGSDSGRKGSNNGSLLPNYLGIPWLPSSLEDIFSEITAEDTRSGSTFNNSSGTNILSLKIFLALAITQPRNTIKSIFKTIS